MSHNAPYGFARPPKFCITLVFSFFQGHITAVPREIENNAYAYLGGGGVGARRPSKVHYGRCASGVCSLLYIP